MILNPDLKINANVEYKSTRDGGSLGFVEAGELNSNVLVLSADLPESTRVLDFAKKFPSRFFNMGVAEQNMAGVAAGLALNGKIPFITSFGVFSPGRNWDQIRVSICYSNANVKIISAESGLSVGQDGATHQALEDIAITRVLPNMKVIAPADFEETRKAIVEASKINGPIFIRYCKTNVRAFTTKDSPFEIGKAYKYVEGNDVTILNTGLTLEYVINAAEELEKEGINAEVIHVPTIKPIDKETILESVRKTKCAVTIEDHQVNGGFGSAISEVLASHFPAPVEFIGMQDSFGMSGDGIELLKKYGIYTPNVVQKAKQVISRK